MCSCNKNNAYDTQRIVLVGVKHAGKSSVGKVLASIVNIPFIDADDRIITVAQNYYQMNEPIDTARQLFHMLGAKMFRAVEQESLKTLPHQYIYAAGGGIAECPDAWTIIKDACIILLDVSVDLAWKRICTSAEKTGTMPAFLQDAENSLQHFRTLYDMRRTVYTTHAHIVYNANTKSPQDIALDIVNAIGIEHTV